MTRAEYWHNRLILAVVLPAIAAAAFGLSLLPRHFVIDVLNVLAVWLSIALPVGIVFGHCTLSED